MRLSLNRRWVIGTTIVCVAGVALAVALAIRPVSAESGNWPIEMTYELRHQATPDLTVPLETSLFKFVGTSWSDWDLMGLAGTMEGYRVEVRPDGTVRAGYDSWTALETIDEAQPGHQVAPVSDFAVAHSFLVSHGNDQPEDIEKLPGVSLDPGRAAAVAARLGLLRSDLLAYRTSVSSVSGAVITSDFVVHRPTGLLLLLEEHTDTTLSRRIEVVSLKLHSP